MTEGNVGTLSLSIFLDASRESYLSMLVFFFSCD